MKEIQSLLARADRYLKSARLLLDDGDNESSVSRTYYAMFYAVQAILLTKNLSYSTHKGIVADLGNSLLRREFAQKKWGKS